MGLGKLDARVLLDEPGRAHLGAHDAVTGRVVLSYSPSGKNQTNELFGPLKITVLFQGRAKSKIYQRRANAGQQLGTTNRNQIFRGRVPLFATLWPVQDGPFKIQAGGSQSFPFTIYFPEQRDGSVQQFWDPHPYFESNNVLPPTFNMTHVGFGSRFEAFVAYEVGVQVEIRGIDIKIRHADTVPAIYSQPRVPASEVRRPSMTFKDVFIVQNENLLREEHRPQGFRAKTKAMFNSSQFPTWKADVVVSMPQHLYLNEGISFEVALRVMPDTTAEIIPEARLTSFRLILSALTLVRAEKGLFTERESEGNETLCEFSGRADTPFSKAEDFVKKCYTSPIKAIPHTFSCTNITRSYSLTVQLDLSAAGKTFSIKRGFPVFVHPPVLESALPGPSAGSSNATGIAGPSQVAGGDQEALPEYRPPPSYDDAGPSSSSALPSMSPSAAQTDVGPDSTNSKWNARE